MRICMLVTTNVIKDPRVQKEALIASQSKMEVNVIGRKDINFDQNPLKSRPYKVILIDILRNDSDNLTKRIKERLLIGYSMYKQCLKIKPDLIHANDFDTLIPAWMASRKLNCPVIYDSHEIWTENGIITKHLLVKKVVQLIEKYLIRRVKKVISVSNSAAAKLSEMYKIEKPLVVTNCPYSYNNSSCIEKNDDFQVLYQGIFEKDRGYEEFLLSAKKLNNHIKIILRGYGPLENMLKDIVKKSKLEDKVFFAEPVDVSELTKAASLSHVGVVLTKPVSINFEYTVSNKLFEYLQAGIPVILSNVREHKYIIDKFRCGLLLESTEPKCISDAIMKLYNNKELYIQLKKNAEEAAKELCWEKEGMKLINAYKNAV